jgi:hypothetical protein
MTFSPPDARLLSDTGITMGKEGSFLTDYKRLYARRGESFAPAQFRVKGYRRNKENEHQIGHPSRQTAARAELHSSLYQN